MDGEEVETTEAVSIKNGKGTKTVTKRHNGKTSSKTMKLKPKEIKNIQEKKFMPKLFVPCMNHCNKTLRLKKKGTKKHHK